MKTGRCDETIEALAGQLDELRHRVATLEGPGDEPRQVVSRLTLIRSYGGKDASIVRTTEPWKLG